MLVRDDEAVQTWRRLRQEIRGASPAGRDKILQEISGQIRLAVLEELEHSGLGHVGGDFSVTDVMVALYYSILSIDPADPEWNDRDRFILSKGHCSAALYATLASCGFFDSAELQTYMDDLSPLNGHPNRNKVPGVETNTGPLGHGVPVSVGVGLANRLLGAPRRRVFAITGDGELQEGSNWEAFMYAGHEQLSNLTVIVDRNLLQQGAPLAETNDLEPLADKMRAFNWEVREIDGHNFTEIINALETPGDGKPVFVISHSVKGKGVSFMEGVTKWHNATPSEVEFAQARKELQ